MFPFHSFDVGDKLTNNPAETYIRILRNDILRIPKKVKTIERLNLSQYCAKSFRNLIAKYEEYYSNDVDCNANNNIKNIYASQTESNWSEKRISVKRKKSSKTRTYFNSRRGLFTLEHALEKEIGEQENMIFKSAFNIDNNKEEISNENCYFLKLVNNGASCYSNTILQAILSLSPGIFDTVIFLNCYLKS